jgi:hypothetical protein
VTPVLSASAAMPVFAALAALALSALAAFAVFSVLAVLAALTALRRLPATRKYGAALKQHKEFFRLCEVIHLFNQPFMFNLVRYITILT